MMMMEVMRLLTALILCVMFKPILIVLTSVTLTESKKGGRRGSRYVVSASMHVCCTIAGVDVRCVCSAGPGARARSRSRGPEKSGNFDALKAHVSHHVAAADLLVCPLPIAGLIRL